MAQYCERCMEPLDSAGACALCGYLQGQETVSAHQLKPGTVLCERYLLGLPLGQGGFGITYIGRDLRLDMRVAIKEYYPSGYANRNTEASCEMTVSDKDQAAFIERGKERFLEEARVLAGLHGNPGVVDVRDYFEANSTAYIVMEYLEGRDLRECLKRDGLFDADTLFERVMPMVNTLEVVHNRGIIHRDISPDNIMLMEDGHLKLMDFGAAREMNFSDQKSVSVLLKAGYAPEEQYRPKGVQGPWTDVYAFCATLYKCITGVTPDDALERLHADEVKWPSEMGIAINPGYEAVLKKGMSVSQHKRYQSFGELKKAIEAAREQVSAFTIEHAGENAPTACRVSERSVDSDDDGATVYKPKGVVDDDDATVYKPRLSSNEDGATVCKPRGSSQNGAADEPAESGTDVQQALESDRKSAVLPETQGVLKAKGGKGKLPVKLISIAAAVVVALVIAGVAIFGGRFDADNAEDILLTPGSDMSVQEFNEAVETLRGRLDAFAGGNGYEMTVNTDSIALKVKSDKFEDRKVQETLQELLTRPIELGIGNEESNNVKNAVEIERSDIKSVTLKDGPIAGFDASAYNYEEGYKVLRLELTDAFVSANKKALGKIGDDAIIMQDYGFTDNYFIWHARPVEDMAAYDLAINDKLENYWNTLVYDYTHDPLPKGFYFVVSHEKWIKWEKPGEGLAAGENQVDSSELSGKLATVEFSLYNKDEKTEGELLDIHRGFRRRLDGIGQPYALGEYSQGEGEKKEDYLCLKTSPSRLCELVLKFACASSHPYLYHDGYSEYWSSSLGLSVDKTDDGWKITAGGGKSIEYNSSAKKFIERLKTGDEVAFTDRSSALLTGTLEAKKGDVCTFGDIKGLDGSSVDDEGNEWFIEFFKQIAESDDDNVASLYLSDKSTQITEDGKLMTGNGLELVDTAERDEIRATVEKVVPKKEVFFKDDSIYVSLKLPVDKNLPETGLKTARKIYEAVGLNRANYNSLVIYLIDEDNEQKERGRVFFRRTIDPDGAPVYYANGVFRCGRLEAYKEDFKKLIEEGSYWKKMASKDYSWTFE